LSCRICLPFGAVYCMAVFYACHQVSEASRLNLPPITLLCCILNLAVILSSQSPTFFKKSVNLLPLFFCTRFSMRLYRIIRRLVPIGPSSAVLIQRQALICSHRTEQLHEAHRSCPAISRVSLRCERTHQLSCRLPTFLEDDQSTTCVAGAPARRSIYNFNS
jgi:hypothetical protein